MVVNELGSSACGKSGQIQVVFEDLAIGIVNGAGFRYGRKKPVKNNSKELENKLQYIHTRDLHWAIKRTTDTQRNKSESQRHYAEGKKSDTQRATHLMIPFTWSSRIVKTNLW